MARGFDSCRDHGRVAVLVATVSLFWSGTDPEAAMLHVRVKVSLLHMTPICQDHWAYFQAKSSAIRQSFFLDLLPCSRRIRGGCGQAAQNMRAEAERYQEELKNSRPRNTN